MEPLVTIKLVLIRFQMYPADDGEISNKWKIGGRLIMTSFFLAEFSGSIGSLIFVFKIISIDLQQSLLALMPASALINSLYSIVVALLLRQKAKQIFMQLSAIYDACE